MCLMKASSWTSANFFFGKLWNQGNQLFLKSSVHIIVQVSFVFCRYVGIINMFNFLGISSKIETRSFSRVRRLDRVGGICVKLFGLCPLKNSIDTDELPFCPKKRNFMQSVVLQKRWYGGDISSKFEKIVFFNIYLLYHFA